jgi:hypothetical protein
MVLVQVLVIPEAKAKKEERMAADEQSEGRSDTAGAQIDVRGLSYNDTRRQMGCRPITLVFAPSAGGANTNMDANANMDANTPRRGE